MAKSLENENRTILISEACPAPFIEAYKMLRTNLRYAAIDNSVKKIIITSAIAGEGKTTVAINLAIALGQLWKRVLLVDVDLRKPKIHRYLNLRDAKRTGVTAALTGKIPLEENIQYLENKSIYVLPAGPPVPNPTELLQSKMMIGLIDDLTPKYDFILFDTPPVSIVADAAALSPLTDGVIYVIRQNYTPRDAARRARESLSQANARVLGCVLNSFDSDRSNHFNAGYYRRYYGYSK